ncbi:hypothetical protein EV401DRAFT_1176800 [Pisolithus croceorrhizus]|nr:hypothetical protein EV401DRAFT_1176800 [Pisolithus croceorrhizus]
MANTLLHGQYFIISLQDNEHLDVSNIVPAIFPRLPFHRRSQSSRSTEGITPTPSGSRIGTPVVKRIVSLPSKTNLLRSGLLSTENFKMHTRNIQRRDDPAGWTVPPLEETELRQVTLSPLISTPSLPLQFLPRQLFSVMIRCCPARAEDCCVISCCTMDFTSCQIEPAVLRNASLLAIMIHLLAPLRRRKSLPFYMPDRDTPVYTSFHNKPLLVSLAMTYQIEMMPKS